LNFSYLHILEEISSRATNLRLAPNNTAKELAQHQLRDRELCKKAMKLGTASHALYLSFCSHMRFDEVEEIDSQEYEHRLDTPENGFCLPYILPNEAYFQRKISTPSPTASNVTVPTASNVIAPINLPTPIHLLTAENVLALQAHASPFLKMQLLNR
jgi:hypothetical protein